MTATPARHDPQPVTRDRYRVVGNPIAHSRSPELHAAFALQTGEPVDYDRALIPVDPPEAFEAAIRAFAASGGRGCNVTLPFKERAARLATRLTDRARAAGAANTLMFQADGGIVGDNTDGAGLVEDLTGRLGFALAGRRVTVLGAGGAARGIVLPLLAAGVAALAVANRTPERAQALAADVGAVPTAQAAGVAIRACGLADAPAADLIINTTAAGLVDGGLALPPDLFRGCTLAYDCVYGARPTPFMIAAQSAGVACVSDGLGMLVEQAAESFLLWRGVRPLTAPVYARLRAPRP